MLVNNPKEIAYLSPRVAGNAVYMARVMLSIDTLDTETYSAKSINLSDVNIFDHLKLFPNPSSEFIHYQLPILENESGFVQILDVSGKIVEEWKVNSYNTIGSLDVSNYSKGIYLFELNLNNGKSIVKKLVVK
ncbi:MAG: T9SS type A sorting domain-containing protein [Flavobacteriales bacterium]|nr:T9SS type A sorting domain-containing protein [Flavobacteriales bacterium]